MAISFIGSAAQASVVMRQMQQGEHNLMLCQRHVFRDYPVTETNQSSQKRVRKEPAMFELLLLSITAGNVLAGYMAFSAIY